jgi:hypothetical protein
MDPNTALHSILCGHLIADHVEALRDWMRDGGFAPRATCMPVDCHVAFSDWCKDTDVVADQNGIGGMDLKRRHMFMPWAEVLKLHDSEYDGDRDDDMDHAAELDTAGRPDATTTTRLYERDRGQGCDGGPVWTVDLDGHGIRDRQRRRRVQHRP